MYIYINKYKRNKIAYNYYTYLHAILFFSVYKNQHNTLDCKVPDITDN